MAQDKIDILERSLKREKAARKVAEQTLESKSKDLNFLQEELKKTNLKLKDVVEQKSSQLESVFENINDGYILMDMSSNILKMNDIASSFFGYNVKKERLNVFNLIHPDDLEYGTRSFISLKEEGVFTNYRTRVLTKDKQVKWVQINGNLIFDKDNKPTGAQGIIRDITFEKKAEELLTESENRLASLIKNLDSAVLLEDENRKIILTNSKFCELFNIPISPDLLKGEDSLAAANENKQLFKYPEDFISRLTNIFEKKQQVLGDKLIMADGKILERDFIPILKGSEYKGHLWTFKDITLRKKYEESLEAQKENYSNIIANMNLGLVELNADAIIILVNQSFVEISGYSEEELLGKKAKEVIQLVSDVEVIKTEKNKHENSESTPYELKIKNKSGGIRTLLISSAPNYDIDGRVIGTIEIYLDITETKRISELIEEQKKELDVIVQNSSVGIALTADGGSIIRTNKSIQKLLGYSEVELSSLSIKDVSFRKDYPASKAYIDRMISGEIDNFIINKKYVRKDGSILWAKTNVSAVRNSFGALKYQVALIEDITLETERTLIINMINDLAKSILGKHDIYEIAWEIAQKIATYLATDDCIIYFVNHKTSMLEQIAAFGSKKGDDNEIINKITIPINRGIVGSIATTGKSEIINDTSKDKRYVVDDERRFSELSVPIISEGMVIGVIDSEHKDKYYFREEQLETLESIASLVAMALKNAFNIRERKNTETRNKQLVKKLEKSNNELNEYAHVVSHDLKSPLRSIDALVSWIKTDNESAFDELTLRNFDLIEVTLEKMEQLISDILLYSSIASTTSGTTDVNLDIVLKDLQKILFIPENISVRVLNKLPIVKGEKTKLQQLFQNLLSNAIKFNDKENGLIQIDVLETKTFYEFSIKDNGIGIQKKYHDKIFKFFHSLKPSKESSGIGLSIVKKIVDVYQGEIWIESEPKIGTTFYFTLKK
jgi:PAS domain S-box-containing protein